MTSLFRLILLFFHWCISLRDFVGRVYSDQRLKFFQLFEISPVSLTSIKSKAAHLRKLPVHLGLVVVEDDLNLVDIAKVVIWAVAAGISYVTLYDHKGFCKKNRENILNKVQEEEKRLKGKQYNETSIGYSFNGSDRADSLKPNTFIRIVGPEDGRHHLVTICRHLSHRISDRQMDASHLNVAFLDAAVHENNSYPDPDLVLKFGRVESLLGFLPWQIRLSEILSLPTHHHIDFRRFFNALVRFGELEQRFGK